MTASAKHQNMRHLFRTLSAKQSKVKKQGALRITTAALMKMVVKGRTPKDVHNHMYAYLIEPHKVLDASAYFLT